MRESLAYVAVGYLSTGSDTQGGDWGDRPPKTSESNLIHHAFVQPWNSIRDIRPFCRPFIVVTYTSFLLQWRTRNETRPPNITDAP